MAEQLRMVGSCVPGESTGESLSPGVHILPGASIPIRQCYYRDMYSSTSA